MPLTSSLTKVAARTRGLSMPLRFAGTAAIVACVFLLRRAVNPILPDGYPYLLSFVAILLSSCLFARGSGLVATVLCGMLAVWFYLPPLYSPVVENASDIFGLFLFLAVGAAISLVVETMHRAMTDLAEAEQDRALLLQEFRHRTRNDLSSLVGLLLLRARAAPSDAARDELREAAEHAMALARIHTRLASDSVSENVALVNTRDFIVGLCDDLNAVLAGEGLRPVALVTDVESHVIPNERAVQLGLVLNETVTNALKYAFPDDRAGTVQVRFVREGADLVLVVADDGVGLPADGDMDGRRAGADALPHSTGLGTRLLRALAAQLRGSFSRGPGPGGVGTVAELRFPVDAPSMTVS
jgi:two-component sensor histidine kinase